MADAFVTKILSVGGNSLSQQLRTEGLATAYMSP